MTEDSRPLVSIVLPAFNEAALLADNLSATFDYLRTLQGQYRFEVKAVSAGKRVPIPDDIIN